MEIPPSPPLGGRARCLWHLQRRPWRPSARFLPLAGAADLVGSAAARGGGADLLDRQPPAGQCPELAARAGGLLRVRVSDDGCGGARLQQRGGLAGLAERAGTVDGRLQVTSPPRGPTVVTVDLPSHA